MAFFNHLRIAAGGEDVRFRDSEKENDERNSEEERHQDRIDDEQDGGCDLAYVI